MMSWLIERDLIVVLSLLSFILLLIPATWNIRSWNAGYLLASFWLGWQCLMDFIGAIVWRNNVTNWAPVFCDITIRITYASSVGIVAAGLVITRRVSEIASGRMTGHSKRRVILTDLAIGLIPPLIQIMIFWFIQDHRFDIFEDVGCSFVTQVNLLSLFLSGLWPIIIGTASICYSVITLRALYKRRKEQLDLQQMGEGLTFDHYYRLIFMVTLEMAATVPISIWNIISVYIPPFDDSWKNLATHRRGLDRVEQISTMSWLADGDTRSAIEHSEWISIACAICYFVAFGTTNEARDRYRLVALKFLEFFGVRKEVYNRSAGHDPDKSTLVFAGQSVTGPQTSRIDQDASVRGIGSTESRPPPESIFTRGSEVHFELSHENNPIESV
ncbi:hypothetical protein NLI96_g3455 [Meripilus lineatus]|uniref:Uncharacterized protein n=1 Tax=Meripilus lineatus TaxID=2056292 RepID=A0AAD5YL13_9APHY|nr:hypothetical protein NLI96_g3455 [Physisporinus lineatus]